MGLFVLQKEEDEEKAMIGFWSAFTWLVGMKLVTSLLSKYVLGKIEVLYISLGVDMGLATQS